MIQTLHGQKLGGSRDVGLVPAGRDDNLAGGKWYCFSATKLLQLTIAVSGALLVTGSLVQNWFDIPTASQPAQSLDDIVRQTPNCQIWFQAIIAIGTLILFAFFFFGKQRLVSTLVACGLLFVTLTFPYFVMLKSPVLAADACWLQMQHDNLTWLGGDIYAEAETGMYAWKAKVYWVDPPRQVSVAPVPDWSVFEMGLDKTEDILIWLGYSNTFCQFVRTGWFCSVLGAFLLALATVITSRSANLEQAGYGIAFLCTLIFVCSAIALSGPFRARPHLKAAAFQSSMGNHEHSLQELDRCVKLFPVLAQDSYYISQRALLEFKSGYQSEFARLHQARSLESSGRYDQSFEHWNELCQSNVSALRREALRAVLRFAVQDFNCNRIELARQRLQFVLSHQPGNVKVIHYLQIISIREKNPQLAFQMCDWMHEVTEHLNFNTTKVLKSASHQNAKLVAAITDDEWETWNRIVEAR